MIVSGVGRHIFCLPLANIPDALQWSIYAQIVNILGIGLVKISVCLCILRVIDKVGKALSRFLYLMITFISVSHFAQVRGNFDNVLWYSSDCTKLSKILLFLIQCRPMAKIWNPYLRGQCFSSHVTYLAGYLGFCHSPPNFADACLTLPLL